ncbi:MAG TPA: adenosylcobinamide-GDP ribazoletransferase [Xanthobacteraceae bacterium]|nr:adenosylcobinamide-GDP ribazoletransferase [Xanthobacteraceae bacterium]
MASLVHDTLAWLRVYSALPIPPLAGEDSAQAPDRAATAHLVPVAGAALGAAGAIALIAAGGLRLPPLLTATLAVAVLVAVTGALPERSLARTAERLADPTRATDDALSMSAVVALVLALVMRIGALDGLVAFGSLHAALALIAACAVSRAAALALTPDFASQSTGESGGFGAFQRLALAALAIAAAAVLPTYGIGAAAAGIAAAVAAAAGVMALAPRLSRDDEGPLAGAAAQAAEIAFLVAVLVFARSP